MKKPKRQKARESRQSDLVDSANMYWFFLVPTEHEAFIDVVTSNQGAGL